MDSAFRSVDVEKEDDIERFLAGVAPIKPKVQQLRFWGKPFYALIFFLLLYLIGKGWLS
jgi:hypothetical protein